MLGVGLATRNAKLPTHRRCSQPRRSRPQPATRRRRIATHGTCFTSLENTHAILLRKIKLTESSLIITWLTQSLGKLKTVAKGARRPKSPFAGRLDLFFAADITFARSRRSELHILREVSVLDPRDGLRRQYERTLLAAYFVELVEMTTEFEHPVPEIYDLLRRALDYLEHAAPTRRAMIRFEGSLGRLLGVIGEHNADVQPSHAILRLAGHLPPERRALLRTLARTDKVDEPADESGP